MMKKFKGINLYNSFWVILHLLSFIVLIVIALLCMSFGHSLDVHYPTSEEMAEEKLKEEQTETEDDDGNINYTYVG